MDKNISNIIKIVKGRIEDPGKIALREIDTIVNAANPTLMGSDRGVDGCIHAAVKKCLNNGQTLAENICKELDIKAGQIPGTEIKKKNSIRCNRGQAVMTGGYGLCENIIHVVGSQYDGMSKSGIDCSSSRIALLESCYFEIIKIVRENTGIRNIAIPVIGAGDYDFPFKLAVKIALAGIGNALAEWKNEDEELFAMSSLDNIYFYIYDDNAEECKKNFKIANRVFNKYKPLFREDRKVVFQNSFMAHMRYLNEIIRYDKKRGYFATARLIRILLMAVRFLFMPVMLIKDVRGTVDWEKRRRVVERLALAKVTLPVIFWMFWNYGFFIQNMTLHEIVFPGIIIYSISDTITYLMTLILMADIQRPSANIIRSMIMLLVNYIEVSLGMSYLYFINYKNIILLNDAVQFGVLGTVSDKVTIGKTADYAFLYADAAIKFFFASLVFGYFANHMKQRRFRS